VSAETDAGQGAIEADKVLIDVQVALEKERWDLAQQLFVANYDDSHTDSRDRATNAAAAAGAFLDVRDEVMRTVLRQAESRARRAAKRAQRKTAAGSQAIEDENT
jgi:hypothetical protein